MHLCSIETPELAHFKPKHSSHGSRAKKSYTRLQGTFQRRSAKGEKNKTVALYTQFKFLGFLAAAKFSTESILASLVEPQNLDFH